MQGVSPIGTMGLVCHESFNEDEPQTPGDASQKVEELRKTLSPAQLVGSPTLMRVPPPTMMLLNMDEWQLRNMTTIGDDTSIEFLDSVAHIMARAFVAELVLASCNGETLLVPKDRLYRNEETRDFKWIPQYLTFRDRYRLDDPVVIFYALALLLKHQGNGGRRIHTYNASGLFATAHVIASKFVDCDAAHYVNAVWDMFHVGQSKRQSYKAVATALRTAEFEMLSTVQWSIRMEAAELAWYVNLVTNVAMALLHDDADLRAANRTILRGLIDGSMAPGFD